MNHLEEFSLNFPLLEYLDLGQNNLTEIPTTLPSTLKSLVLNFNRITALNISIQQLTHLELSMNNITVVNHDLVFPNLTYLDLSKNNITDFPDFTQFSPKVSHLDISGNFASVLPHLPETITYLDISSNSFTELQECKTFPHLSTLIIENNEITHLTELPNTIQVLQAGNNKIATIDASDTPALVTVELDHNLLTETPIFRNNKVTDYKLNNNLIETVHSESFGETIYFVSLCSNKIRELPQSLFSLKLMILNVSNNQLTSLPEGIENSPCSFLNISVNPISTLPTNFPHKLCHFFACYCDLTELPASLCECKYLRYLYIAGNQISHIPEGLAKLKVLYAGQNHITQFPTLPLNITYLDLSYNDIAELPETLNYPKLTDFDLSYNKISAFPISWCLPRLKVFKIAFNPILQTVLEHPKNRLPNLSLFDISGCDNIDFPCNPKITEIHISPAVFSRHPVNSHLLLFETNEKCSAPEIRGLRDSMEDSVVVRHFGNLNVYGVFDGHSGSKTSTFAAMSFVKAIDDNATFSEKWLFDHVKKLDRMIRKRSFGDGSTMAVAIVKKEEKKMLTAHLGDSRIVLLKEDGSVLFSTIDHKAAYRREWELIRERGGWVVNNRINGAIAVSRGLGDVHCFPNVCPNPEISEVDISEAKWLFIACDGVFDVMENEDIGEIAKDCNTADQLAYKACYMSLGKGSSDNISVIAADLQ